MHLERSGLLATRFGLRITGYAFTPPREFAEQEKGVWVWRGQLSSLPGDDRLPGRDLLSWIQNDLPPLRGSHNRRYYGARLGFAPKLDWPRRHI